MSKHPHQSEGMKALEQNLNDHMEICRLKRKAKRLKSENALLKAEVERLQQEKNELAVMIHPVALRAWINCNAAKEGKQP